MLVNLIITNQKIFNLKQIIKISEEYIAKGPKSRAIKCIDCFPDKELETKINIEKLSDVKIILNNISELGFSKVNHRTEFHHFFSDNFIYHGILVLIKDFPEVWIKQKRDFKIVYTPKENLPILLRTEIKITPSDLNYIETFLDTIKMKYIGSFKKECIDFSFWYEDLSFTTTLSLAKLSKKDKLYQIEFEFDGCKERTLPPGFDSVLVQFEKMFSTICPNYLQKLNTHTKLEWLISLNKRKRNVE